MQELNFAYFFVKIEKLKGMCIDLPLHAVRVQSLKFRPFVYREKSRWQKITLPATLSVTQFDVALGLQKIEHKQVAIFMDTNTALDFNTTSRNFLVG